MDANIIEYARKHIEATSEEDGIKVSVIDDRLYIEVASGKCYQISDDEIFYQATEYLQSELNYINGLR